LKKMAPKSANFQFVAWIVPSSQALPGFIITAHPSVCVSAVLGVLAVWIKKKIVTGGG